MDGRQRYEQGMKVRRVASGKADEFLSSAHNFQVMGRA